MLDLLQHVVDSAVESLEACTLAGVSIITSGRVNSPVVSDPAVLELDALQYSIGTGPCLDVLRSGETLVASEDLEHDARYQAFGAEATRRGIRAVLAYRLYVDTNSLGAVNFYAPQPHAFTEADRIRCVVHAGLASLALNALQAGEDSEGLRVAVENRDVIGQAKGILMERHGIDADAAFKELRTISMEGNVKLRDVARRLVEQLGADASSPNRG